MPARVLIESDTTLNAESERMLLAVELKSAPCGNRSRYVYPLMRLSTVESDKHCLPPWPPHGPQFGAAKADARRAGTRMIDCNIFAE